MGLRIKKLLPKQYDSLLMPTLKKLNLRAKDVQNLIVRLDYVDALTGIEHIYATQKIRGLSVPGSNLSLHTKGARVIESNNSIPTASYSIKPINASVTLLQAILQPSSSEPTTSNRFFLIITNCLFNFKLVNKLVLAVGLGLN